MRMKKYDANYGVEIGSQFGWNSMMIYDGSRGTEIE